MDRIAVAGLVRMDLPGGVIVRLSEGAAVRWGADTFVPRHSVYGAIGSAEAIEEGIGNTVPAAKLVLDAPSTASAAMLVQPGNQKSRVRMWLAEYDPADMTVTDAGSPVFDGFLDQSRLIRARDRLQLEIAIVSQLEHLFELNIGNSLNPTFHKSVWPGEGGEDHATGLGLPDAWGVEAPQGSSRGGLANVISRLGLGAGQ